MDRTRQLAAIMFTDIVGYSSLMGQDEEGTMLLLAKSINIQKSLVDEHRGKWIKELGDGVIMLFDSVLDAVHCAIEIQKEVKKDPDLFLKIAIHSGEVIWKDGDVFGDGVNLTARIEQLAQSNSILLSERAVSDIKNIKSIQTTELGSFQLKNISETIKIHAITGEDLSVPDLSQFRQMIIDRMGGEETGNSDDKLVLQVKALVDENLSNPQLSVTFLCKGLNMSRPQLYRRLLAETGFSPSDYIREMRLKKAARLLKSRGHNVSQTAYEVGFNNLSYFSKSFQDRFGSTPSEYQKRQKNSIIFSKSLDKFIGREKEIKDIIEGLKRTRLLTLTGTGGTGKTRLALEILAKTNATFKDGTYLVQLAPLSEARQVLPKIAQILKIQQDPAKDTLDIIIDTIGDQERLIILDNFEHVLEAATDIKSILLACPGLRVLVTSREILKITGEHEYIVPQLPVPEIAEECELEKMLNIASVDLFVKRAQAVKPSFELNEGNKEAIGSICRYLDGLPLAIELAAARIKLFSPQALLTRLRTNLDVLKSSSADQPERHRTLRNAIDWSYNLLSPEEQTLFRRLSVFSGGCTLEAAEEVCFQGYGDNFDIIDHMVGLIDKSLLQRENQLDGEPRFYLLETIKAFAEKRLERAQEKNLIMRAYIFHFEQKLIQIEKHLTGPDQGKWCDILELDLDNLRAILRWSEEREDAETGLKMAVLFWRYWVIRSMMREGSSWLKRMLDIPSENRDTIFRCRALNSYGIVFGTTSKISDARPVFEEALAVGKRINYKEGMADSLSHLGWVYQYSNDLRKCEDVSTEALEIYQELNNQRGISVSYSNLGQAALYRCELSESLTLYEKASSLRFEIGDTRGYAFNLINAAWVNLHMGLYDQACRKTEKARKILTDLSDKPLSAWSLSIQAFALLYNNQLDDAEVMLKKAQPLWESSGNIWATVFSILLHVKVLYAKGKLDDSQTLLEKIEKNFDENVYGSNVYLFVYIKTLLELEHSVMDNTLPSLRNNLVQIIEKRLLVFLCDYLEVISEILVRHEAMKSALILYSAASKYRRDYQLPIPSVRRDFSNRLLDKLKDAFKEGQFESLWIQGQSTDPEACIEIINQSNDIK